jgi:hypothetical protein
MSFVLINIFLILYLFVATFWNIKNQFYIDDIIKQKISYMVRYLGLWHSWIMYTSPYKSNHSIFAKLKFNSGTEKVIVIWDNDTATFLETVKYCRLKKLSENILKDNVDFGIRKFFCHYLFIKHSTLSDSVTEIALIDESTSIPDFFKEHSISQIESKIFYTYRIPHDISPGVI